MYHIQQIVYDIFKTSKSKYYGVNNLDKITSAYKQAQPIAGTSPKLALLSFNNVVFKLRLYERLVGFGG